VIWCCTVHQNSNVLKSYVHSHFKYSEGILFRYAGLNLKIWHFLPLASSETQSRRHFLFLAGNLLLLLSTTSEVCGEVLKFHHNSVYPFKTAHIRERYVVCLSVTSSLSFGAWELKFCLQNHRINMKKLARVFWNFVWGLSYEFFSRLVTDNKRLHICLSIHVIVLLYCCCSVARGGFCIFLTLLTWRRLTQLYPNQSIQNLPDSPRSS